MNVSFVPSTPVPGVGTVTLAVSSTWPAGGAAVFVGATPAGAAVVLAGLANCTGATAAIDATQRALTITLPSGCVLPANQPVTVQIPSGFFAPNPAAGTTVALALTTSADTQPSAVIPYTIGVSVCERVRAVLPTPCPPTITPLLPAAQPLALPRHG